MTASRGTDDRSALIRELFELGRQTHVGLLVPPSDFEDALLARVGVRAERARLDPTGEQVVPLLRATSGADLYLAVGCDLGVAGAWERLTSAYEPRIRKLALHLGYRDVDSISADLFGDLSSPSNVDWARTRLGTYLGAGTLFAWLGVVLRRRIADAVRKRPAPLVRIASSPPAPPADPLEQAMVEEIADRLRGLLHTAWESLDDNERLVLLFKYREGLGQRTIASLMHLSESRISRIVSQAVTRIRSRLLQKLESEQPGRFKDQDRLWHALLHVVARHLSEAGPIGESQPPRRTRHG